MLVTPDLNSVNVLLSIKSAFFFLLVVCITFKTLFKESFVQKNAFTT